MLNWELLNFNFFLVVLRTNCHIKNETSKGEKEQGTSIIGASENNCRPQTTWLQRSWQIVVHKPSTTKSYDLVTLSPQWYPWSTNHNITQENRSNRDSPQKCGNII